MNPAYGSQLRNAGEQAFCGRVLDHGQRAPRVVGVAGLKLAELTLDWPLAVDQVLFAADIQAHLCIVIGSSSRSPAGCTSSAA